MRTYTLAEVAEAHVPPEIKNPIRWLRERLNRGEIPGKRLTRGVWVMTDAHVDAWLSDSTVVERVSDSADSAEAVVSISGGLSQRSRRRVSA